MKTDLFQSCGHFEFSKFAGILSAALSQHYLLEFEIAQLEFHHLTSFVHSDWSVCIAIYWSVSSTVSQESNRKSQMLFLWSRDQSCKNPFALFSPVYLSSVSSEQPFPRLSFSDRCRDNIYRGGKARNASVDIILFILLIMSLGLELLLRRKCTAKIHGGT